MTARRFSLVTLLMLMFVTLSQPALAEANHITATLLAETGTPAPGSTVTLAVAMRPEAGWHGYWSNPGEAGFEPRFAWTLPKGAALAPVQFPVPQPLVIGGLMNYVFEGPHALLVRMALPPGIKPGTRLPIALKLDYLACTDKVCVPQHADLSTELTLTERPGEPEHRAQFDAWRAKLPTPLGAQARFARAGAMLRLVIPFPAATPLVTPHFFPAANGLIVDAGEQRFERDGDLLVAEIPAPRDGAVPVAGVLSIGGGRGLTLVAQPGPVPAFPVTGLVPVLLALGGAILGGLILNVMPCVFPILSLKALSLAKASGGETAARRDALGYTLGAVLVCAGLGGAILVLRAGGASVGWAFQLQDPRVIIALLVLTTAIALNLAGLFELPSVAGNLASGNSVATGALAAFVATPCTGPFMGAALGAALVLPWPAALAVFAGLGLGLALPFLLLGFVPGLRRMLPRPGLWMVTLRRILAIPMFVTALGLAWLLGQEVGSNGATIGLAATLGAALALWWAGLRQAAGRAGLAIASIAVMLATGAGIAALPGQTRQGEPAVASGALHAEPFSEARLAELRTGGHPVFVYFTADWCLTCKVNERVAIDRPEVAAAFAKGQISVLAGDWTRNDPAIGRFLEAQGRSGVPLYLFYPARGDVQVLPQILTPGMLTALAR